MINNAQHVARQENGLSHMIARLWYWAFGGIHDAAKRALNLRYVESMEFNISAALMVLGLWLMIPGETFFAGEFTSILTSALPDWGWGMLYIIIGRYGIHCMLNGNIQKREWSLSFAVAAWTFLTLVSLTVHPLGIETALLAYMTCRSAVLYWQLGKV